MTACGHGNGQYAIADLVIDPAQMTVMRGDEVIDLPPLSFRLLTTLADAAPAVVSHEQLAAHVWHGRVVSPETMTQRVKLLRQALGDSAQNPRYVGVVRGAGYKLLTVPKPVAPPAPRASRRRLYVAATAALVIIASVVAFTIGDVSQPKVAAAEDLSLAVLPFEANSAASPSPSLGPGIASEVVHNLTDSPELRLIAADSVRKAADTHSNTDEIATLLGARYVLHGTVEKSEGTLRVTAVLDDKYTMRSLWTRTYTRPPAFIQDMVRAIASDVRSVLELRRGDQRAASSPGDPEAYAHFLRGRFFHHRRADGDVARAEAEYRNALAVDPRLARAWVGLAGIADVRYWETGELTLAESEAQQRNALLQALAIDEQLAVAHARLTWHFEVVGDDERAAHHRARAIDLAPDDPLVLMIRATKSRRHGDLESTVDYYNRAIARDPLSASYLVNLSHLLLFSGRTHEATEVMDRLVAVAPHFEMAFERALVLVQQRRYSDALAVGNALKEPLQRLTILAMAQDGLGKKGDALRSIEQLELLDSPEAIVRLAHVKARAGDTNAPFEAMARLERVCANQQSPWQPCMGWLYDLMDLRFTPYLRGQHDNSDWLERFDAIMLSWRTRALRAT
ncbi:MAG: winged helix-turn-helix domain-containing protein [Pseudomonadota bacterium]